MSRPPYRLEAEQIGPEFTGDEGDLHRFVEILADQCGVPKTYFRVEPHAGQDPDAYSPNEPDWLAALNTFMQERPELFT